MDKLKEFMEHDKFRLIVGSIVAAIVVIAILVLTDFEISNIFQSSP